MFRRVLRDGRHPSAVTDMLVSGKGIVESTDAMNQGGTARNMHDIGIVLERDRVGLFQGFFVVCAGGCVWKQEDLYFGLRMQNDERETQGAEHEGLQRR